MFLFTSFPHLANDFFAVVATFFVIIYLMLTLQAFWVCEIMRPGWKNVPGSICVLTKAVPITQMASELSCPSVSPSMFSPNLSLATIISDGILVFTPLLVW